VLPTFLIQFFHFSQATSTFLGGTSLLDHRRRRARHMRQMESQMMMRSYEGFLR
jgi:preprotein translocase subunit SecY